MPKYMISSQLSERQVESDVATYLGLCLPPDEDAPFCLLDVDEQVTGADRHFDGAVPLFLQFKKSLGLRSVREVEPSKRRNRSVLESVREFRALEGLEDSPSLYFQLRAKAKGAVDFQHNVLLSYDRVGGSRSFYVAPLALDRHTYTQMLFNPRRFLLDPFYWRIGLEIRAAEFSASLRMIPFLRAHVSIPPHERVDTHEHFYAFAESGVDVSWHSPSVVDRGPNRLSDVLARLTLGLVQSNERPTTKESLANAVLEVGRRWGFENTGASETDTPIEVLGRHSRWLRSTHQIRQMLLLFNSERLRRLR